MGLSFTVGGAKEIWEGGLAREVVGLLDNAFGEEGDWEGVPLRHFGEAIGDEWAALQKRAGEVLGVHLIPNLLALGGAGRGVYLPSHIQVVSLPLREGEPLRCASLPGLRSELADLAERWGLSLADPDLLAILDEQAHDGDPSVQIAPEVIGLARIAMAANEAVRRDCPLWLFG